MSTKNFKILDKNIKKEAYISIISVSKKWYILELKNLPLTYIGIFQYLTGVNSEKIK